MSELGNFVGTILVVIGILWMSLAGTCAISLGILLVTSPVRDDRVLTVAAIALAFTVVGVATYWLGRNIVRWTS